MTTPTCKLCPLSLSLAVLCLSSLFGCGEGAELTEPTSAQDPVEVEQTAHEQVEPKPNEVAKTEPAGQPAIELSELTTTFPMTAVGASSTTVIRVRNTGTAPLPVASDGALFEVAAGWGMEAGELTLKPLGTWDAERGILPGAELEVELRFSPVTAGEKDAQVIFFPRDTQLGPRALSATATAIDAGRCHWTLSSKGLDYGVRQPGEKVELSLTLTNEPVVGGGACEITTAQMPAGPWFSALDNQLPILLPQGDSLTVTVGFIAPAEQGDYAGRLLIETNNGTPGEMPIDLRATVEVIP